MTKTLTQSIKQPKQKPEATAVRSYDADEFEADTSEERPAALLAERRRNFWPSATWITGTRSAGFWTATMPEIYTIGYEGISQETLFQTLVYHDIQTLLDIRQLPQSRKPGLSKTALGLAATNYGMQYEHLRALGTPRDLRYRRKIDHDEAAFRLGYLTYLATQGAAMESLVEQVRRERCCLLCYEANVGECHRLMVANRAVEMTGGALTAVHLSAGESREEA